MLPYTVWLVEFGAVSFTSQFFCQTKVYQWSVDSRAKEALREKCSGKYPPQMLPSSCHLWQVLLRCLLHQASGKDQGEHSTKPRIQPTTNCMHNYYCGDKHAEEQGALRGSPMGWQPKSVLEGVHFKLKGRISRSTSGEEFGWAFVAEGVALESV